MRSFFVALNILIVAVLIFLLYSHFAISKKSVYINVPKLLSSYKGALEARTELEKKTKAIQANVDTLGVGFQKEMQKYEKERSGMSKKEKELSEQLLRSKEQQFMQYQEAMRNKMNEENRKIQENVLSHINAFIKKYGEDKGYDYILGANSNGALIYARESLDVTEEILKELNAEFDKGKKQ